MKKYKVRTLESAEHDIRKNYKYISEVFDNDSAARAHTIDICREINKLEYMPRAHKIYENKFDLECRVTRVRQYLILYIIDDNTSTVYIVRIFHSHMNPDKVADSEETNETFRGLRKATRADELQNEN